MDRDVQRVASAQHAQRKLAVIDKLEEVLEINRDLVGAVEDFYADLQPIDCKDCDCHNPNCCSRCCKCGDCYYIRTQDAQDVIRAALAKARRGK